VHKVVYSRSGRGNKQCILHEYPLLSQLSILVCLLYANSIKLSWKGGKNTCLSLHFISEIAERISMKFGIWDVWTESCVVKLFAVQILPVHSPVYNSLRTTTFISIFNIMSTLWFSCKIKYKLIPGSNTSICPLVCDPVSDFVMLDTFSQNSWKILQMFILEFRF
jgi:hypothetical protein